MRELSIHELSFVSGAGGWLRPLVEGAKALAKNPVAQGGATGGATYVASNVAAGNDMTVAGATGSTVAGMFGVRFGGKFTAAFAGATAGGLAERSVNGVNTVLKPDNKNQDKSGNNYGH
ncbi:hypothetical protein LU290_09315 [Moraxella nasibovis]|uniref:hypothetical protein n=1 Tax=Moraxella nasibovis TaxID=2904120 RepID=UPI00240F8AF1|nr:hypothetical protein [Moraxella nasibovis]WFF38434.1 hypothetical protein LU290_09315 [Moraxella nasibovis]